VRRISHVKTWLTYSVLRRNRYPSLSSDDKKMLHFTLKLAADKARDLLVQVAYSTEAP
jgi:hypothetical protein